VRSSSRTVSGLEMPAGGGLSHVGGSTIRALLGWF